MARVVRKVSSKAVAGQKKKGILKNKLFWIIASVVFVIGLAVGITLGIVLNQDSESEGNTVDYFALTEDPKFERVTYASVLNYTNVNYDNPQYSNSLFVENVFVFAYDLSSFYPDASDEDNYNASHADLLKQLTDLQKAIDKMNAEDPDLNIALYIVDTTFGQNSSILVDSNFGGNGDSTTASGQFLFSYIQHGELVTDALNIHGIKLNNPYTTSLTEMLNTTIRQYQTFVYDGLVETEE